MPTSKLRDLEAIQHGVKEFGNAVDLARKLREGLLTAIHRLPLDQPVKRKVIETLKKFGQPLVDLVSERSLFDVYLQIIGEQIENHPDRESLFSEMDVV